jgi:soluble lytic murein transglycosylase
MKPHEILYPLAYWSTVKDVSARYGLDPFLLLSVMREESHFDPMAVSSAGAIGLMQLMPYTARRTARRLDLEIDGAKSIHEIENNITLGAYYLSGLLDRFRSVTPALAAYNAGERRVKRWLRQGQYEALDEFIEDIPFDETRNYVKRIVTTYYRYQVVRFPEHAAGPGIL